jgi:hypothetical protein
LSQDSKQEERKSLRTNSLKKEARLKVYRRKRERRDAGRRRDFEEMDKSEVGGERGRDGAI